MNREPLRSGAKMRDPGVIARTCPRDLPEKMNDSIVVAIITASGSVAVAALVFYLTKRHELYVQWRGEKLNHYKVLFSALSDLAVDGTDKDDANRKFSLATNTISLVAPQYVIGALMEFHNEIKFSNPNKSAERHDRLLNDLVLAVRRDIGLAKGDDGTKFSFHLIGSAPKEPPAMPPPSTAKSRG